MVWLSFKKHIVSLGGTTRPIHIVQLRGRIVGAECCGKVKYECGLKGKTLQRGNESHKVKIARAVWYFIFFLLLLFFSMVLY